MLHAHGLWRWLATYISCVARLFGLMAERYFLCLSPTDFRLVRWTPARTNCLHRIRSSLFANIQPPRSCKSFTSAITDHAPCAHFRFRWRSDSIRLRVKTIGLRSDVLDMCENLETGRKMLR